MHGLLDAAAGGIADHQGRLGRRRLADIKRPDGTRQVTYDGRPLYRFTEDGGAGKVTGDGFKDSFGGTKFTWHAVTTDGVSAGDRLSRRVRLLAVDGGEQRRVRADQQPSLLGEQRVFGVAAGRDPAVGDIHRLRPQRRGLAHVSRIDRVAVRIEVGERGDSSSLPSDPYCASRCARHHSTSSSAARAGSNVACSLARNSR